MIFELLTGAWNVIGLLYSLIKFSIVNSYTVKSL